VSSTGGSTSSSSTGTTPVARHGQLAVTGGKLVDKSGNPVQLKGPSSMWLNWESKKFAEDKQGLQYLRDDWKASLVRAAMGISTTDTKDKDYLSAPDVAKAQVDQVVQNAIDLGMYVIIDWHDHSAETRTEAAKTFFTEMATKWGAYPNVIYETFNEPTKQDWKTVLKPYHEAVVAAIRAVDPDNVIILGTPNWSQFVDVAAASPVTTHSNLMYTLHFYSCSHDAKVRNLAVSALAKGLPLFVTEWGATNADGGTPKNPALCLEEAQAWHDFMNTNKISWAAWKWDECVDKSCFFNPTADVSTTGPWTDEMLNGHAPFVRDRMRE
jgi:endoglucanase